MVLWIWVVQNLSKKTSSRINRPRLPTDFLRRLFRQIGSLSKSIFVTVKVCSKKTFHSSHLEFFDVQLYTIVYWILIFQNILGFPNAAGQACFDVQGHIRVGWSDNTDNNFCRYNAQTNSNQKYYNGIIVSLDRTKNIWVRFFFWLGPPIHNLFTNS